MKRGTPTHPKTAALMRELQIERFAAVGLLELLWHFTAQYAPRGDIGRWQDCEISAAVYWPGAPADLVAGLVKAGWVDKDGVHRLLIHDWAAHADQAVQRRLARAHESFAQSRVPPCLDMTSTPELDTASLPVPVPVPVPVPLPSPPASGGLMLDEATCPACKNRGTLRRSTPERGGGFFCGTRVGGCGEAFARDEWQVVSQLTKRVQDGLRRLVVAGSGPQEVEAPLEHVEKPESPAANPEAQKEWSAAVEALGLSKTDLSWFAQTRALSLADETLTVWCPHEIAVSLIVGKWGARLRGHMWPKALKLVHGAVGGTAAQEA